MAKILSIALNPAIDISSDAARVRHTHKTRTHNQRQFPGGGGVNVAQVIAELGGRPDLICLSGGATGKLLEQMLAELAIELFIVPIGDPVRIAFTVHEEETDLEYRFVPEGPLVTPEELEPVFDLVARSPAEYIVASGSLPRGVPIDTYARLAHIAETKGARFIIDTSGDALKVTLSTAKVFLMKPSLGELEAFVGRKLDHQSAGAAAHEIVSSGAAQYVTVTLGNDGALLASADGVLRVAAIDVPVYSAVGAGDTFVAALSWSLSEGYTIEDAFRFGVAAGAAAVTTAGSDLCARADIFRLYETVRATA